MQEFETYLLENLPKVESFHPHYQDSLHRMIIAGGKRFRPKLLLSIVNALRPELTQNAYPIAASLEYLHTYSLIHDDLPVMDNSATRRGHDTLHVVYDDVTAVLAGDALNTHSFYLIATAPLDDTIKIRLVKELAENGGVYGMVLGQAIDCHFENHPLAIDQLKFLHENKTGKLIAASLKMGAIIANQPEAINDKLYKFGIDLGLLFQIEDDIIDATQSEQEAGKPTNNDEEKNSYITILGLEEALKAKENLKEQLIDHLEEFEPKLSNLLRDIITAYFK
jgi:geranylgeranyl diphosphate synthase type II